MRVCHLNSNVSDDLRCGCDGAPLPGAGISRPSAYFWHQMSSKWLRRLTMLIFFQATAGGHAQQLAFANPLPSTQLLGGSIGNVKIVVLDTNGSLATNSSTQIILSVTGTGKFSLAQTNNATNGVTAFNFSPVTLNQRGLYSLAAAGGGGAPDV